MKSLFASLATVLLTSSAAIAAPNAGPAPSVATAVQPDTAAHVRPPEERIVLARSFLALRQPPEEKFERMREMSLRAASWPSDETVRSSDSAFAVRFADRVMTKAAPIIRAHLLSINEVTAITYASEFSSDELRNMIAFAATSAGKHFLARADFVDTDPAIIAQLMLLQEAIRPASDEARREMCQEATAKRIAAGDKKAKCPLARQDDTEQG